jgi:caffeoyl-CoA O-methyltransferase
MMIGALEGKLLQFLIKTLKAKRIFEIGTFTGEIFIIESCLNTLQTGYSALTMAEALDSDGVIVTCDINEQASKIAEKYFKLSPHGKKV